MRLRTKTGGLRPSHLTAALITALACAVTSTGCTRGVNGEASLHLGLSSSRKSGALSSDVSDIFVNVSGSGISPLITYHCSSHHPGAAIPLCPNLAASGIDIPTPVPYGSNRLIQVLVVFSGANTDVGSFQYGEATQNVSSPNPSVAVGTTLVGKPGATFLQGNVMGRYLTSANAGPTGTMTVQFVPPGGRPSMSLMTQPIFNGWFSGMFLLSTPAINYVINGISLFNSPYLGSPDFTPSGKVFVANIPAYDQINKNNNVTNVQTRSAQELILGFFGPGAVSTQAACYDPATNVTIDQTAAAGTGLAAAPTPFVWNGVNPSSDQAGPLTSTAQNGIAIGSGACAATNSANEFIDHIAFYEANLRNGGDSVAGFRAPWRYVSGQNSMDSSQFVNMTTSGSNTILSWNLLPGTTDPGGIAGVSAFIRPRPQSSSNGDSDLYGNGSGVMCSRAAALGFTQIGPDALTTPGTATQGSMTITNLPAGQQIILCPFIYAGAARVYPDAGQEVWTYSQSSVSGPGPQTGQVNIHLLGSNITQSRVGGPALGSNPITLLRSSFLNGFHNFAFQAGANSKNWLQTNDIAAIEVSGDGGTTWTSAGAATSTTYANGTPLATLNVSSGFASGVLGGSTADSTFVLKVTVTAAAQSSYGLSSTTFTTGPITVLGSTTCSAPTLTLWDNDANAVLVENGTSSLMTAFSGANGTDITKNVRLKWSGCSSGSPAYALLDYATFTGGISPNNCFDDSDVQADQNDPFLIHISPFDRGTNCNLSAFTLSLTSPSNAGTDSVGIGTSGNYTIVHSAVESALAAVLSGTTSFSSYNYTFLMDFLISAPNMSHVFSGAFVNADGNLTGTQPASGSTTWTGTPSGWWTAASQSVTGQSVELTTTPAPTGGNTVNPLIVTYGTSMFSAIPSLVTTQAFNVLAVSSSGLWGGSPLMVLDNGSALQLAYVPTIWTAGAFTYQGNALTTFNMPTDPGFASAPTWVKVFLVNSNNGASYVFLTAYYGGTGNTVLSYGYVTPAGSTPAITWATSQTLSGYTTYDAAVLADGLTNNNALGMLLTNYGGRNFMPATFPVYNGSSWSGGVFFSSAFGLPSSSTSNSALGFALCGDYTNGGGSTELYAVVGTGSSDIFAAIPVMYGTAYNDIVNSNANSPFGGIVLTDGTAIGTASSQIACGAVSSSNSSHPGRLFIEFSPTSSSFKMRAFESKQGGAACNGTVANQNLSLPNSGTYVSTFMESAILSAVPSNFGTHRTGFTFSYLPSSGSYPPTAIGAVDISGCSSGSISSPTFTDLGGVDSTYVKGFVPFNKNGGYGGMSGNFSVYGGGFYYQVHSY